MPVSDTCRRSLAHLKDKETKLRKELNRHQTDEAKAFESERRQMALANRTSSVSSHNSYLNAAQRARKKALDAGRKAAEVSQKLAQNAKVQTNKTRSLQSAERLEKQATDREATRRRQKEKDHVRNMARLSAPQVHYIHIRPPEPEKLRIVYLTANPNLDLRTEAEVRQVQHALRGAKYRERVDVQQRPAATFQDLLDGLNDMRPHIVHFSGHGGGETVQFDNGDLDDTAGRTVDFGLLVEALVATDEPPMLLVLNACDTLDGASTILPAVPVVVGMSNAISDIAAIAFAQQFYAAIASSQSVGAALRQARVNIRAALHDDEACVLPQDVAREDVDIDKLVLVKPPGEAAR